MKRALIALVLAGLGAILIGKSLPLRSHQSEGRAMGTSWKLAWRGNAPANLPREVAAVLEHWEQILSHWRADSDLSRHNRGAPASPDLQRVIAIAEEIRQASQGAFDHQILEAVHSAGFGPAGTGIDLSGVAKGFAVDRVGERLRQLGVNDFIFELGGDILAGDGPWPVEIEDPLGGPAVATITLRNRALATSGNYHQQTAQDGLLKSHLIDPGTRQPVLRPRSSVSVLAPDCATADAWATALFVLGPTFDRLPAGLEFQWQPAP